MSLLSCCQPLSGLGLHRALKPVNGNGERRNALLTGQEVGLGTQESRPRQPKTLEQEDIRGQAGPLPKDGGDTWERLG